ncbi:MAG: hypothetical protein ACI4UF_01770 [Thermoguttaceae bacterium]
MPKISIPVRVRWTLVFILVHFIIFFPYIPDSLDEEGLFWLWLQGPLGMITEAFTLPSSQLSAFLFILAWYLCEVLSVLLWQVYYEKKKIFSRVMLGVFISSRLFLFVCIIGILHTYD